MTTHEIEKLLIRIDKGYVPTYLEKHELESIERISLVFNKKLPRSIKLLKKLSVLDLSHGESLTDISAISSLTTLRGLILSENSALTDISDLSVLTSLTFLCLDGTNVSNISALSSLTSLKYLSLSSNAYWEECYYESALKNWELSEKESADFDYFLTRRVFKILSFSYGKGTSIQDLFYFNYQFDHNNTISLEPLNEFESTPIGVSDISPLSNLTSLRVLDLSGTRVSDINVLSALKELHALNLRDTQVSDINALSGLKNLRVLDISETNVGDITAISGLTLLQGLNLSSLTLTTIPEFLLDLDLDFKIDKLFSFEGIYISGLKLLEQPIDIFSLDHKLIRAYYRSQEKVPINECKVIFLGDAEAGKTHSIKRLLLNGELLTDFDGNSTPGIEITVSLTKIKDTDITVNYWDFGGQEIQHSMHRMFLTERTVYVVFLNARQDPLDERARYWLENINSFASGAPVLLVINKIDQNVRPTFNEKGIRDAYGDQIKDVVRMSALKDEPDIFMKQLQGGINKIIIESQMVSTVVPNSWKLLLKDLREISNYYLTTDEFKEKCEFYYVKDYDRIHDSLAKLFQIIGVSFCYKDRTTADYMLLNPRWLVNALYTIVTNSKDISKNGIITQDDLFDVLKEDCIKGVPIKRVMPNWRYKGPEVNYILGVIRMFYLSYPLKDGSEFFPMLCDGNEKISVSKAVSPEALHYIFQYTYLPVNVLHRLIVEKQRDLDYNYVWYSGAILRNEAQGQTAYIHSIGNKLHIYVDCTDSFYNLNEYLTPILNEIRGINQDMGLQAEELIGIQRNGSEVEIPFDFLKSNLEDGTRYITISSKIGRVDISEILFRYIDNRPIENKKIFNAIVQSLAEMQNEPDSYTKDENARNRFVSQQLRSAGYFCDDQVPGPSAMGKSIGARDGIIRDMNNQDQSIFEGLNLNSLVKSKISSHLDKLLINYNPQGLPYGFMLIYLNCAREKYRSFIDKYREYIKVYAPDTYECVSDPSIVSVPTNGQLLTCIKMDYECGGYYYTIYHIVVRIAAK